MLAEAPSYVGALGTFAAYQADVVHVTTYLTDRNDFATRSVSWFLGEVPPGQIKEAKLEVQAVRASN